MSLRIWLPLNGSLENKGLDDITVTNNGATIDNNGKIGKCYSFNGSNSGINVTGNTIVSLSAGDFSIAFWIYNDDQGDRSIYLATITPTDFGLGIEKTVNEGLRIYWQGNPDYYPSFLIPVQEWCHITVVIKNSNCYCYKNGTLTAFREDGSFSSNKITNIWEYIMLGRDKRTGNTVYKGKMNDVRIYNHALSPLEVKHIAQGLILHYPLSDNSIQSLDNCYAYPRFETNNSNGGWSHWGSSGHAGTYGQTTDTNYIFRNGQTYAHWVANGSSATKDYLLYQEPAFDGGLRSLVAICKEENSKPITNNICYATWNARNGGAVNNSWTSIHSLGNGFYLCKCEGISQSGSNDLVGIYIKPGYKVYFSEVYLENYKSVCSDIFFPSTVIYDTSGYGNNGTPIGSFSVDKNTPRYTVSTKFNGAEVIVVPFTCGSISEAVTVACWGYESNWNVSTAERLLGAATNSSGWCIGDYGSENTLFAFYANGGYNATTGFKQLSTGWHHFVITFDGLNLIYYVDGQQFSKKTFSTKQVATGNYNINIGRHYGSGYNFKGNMSDVRIYATALSAEDVKNLYELGATIDTNGVLSTYEFTEQ